LVPRFSLVSGQCGHVIGHQWVGRSVVVQSARASGRCDGTGCVAAINFPRARLSRAQNYEVPQMYDYKNKPGKVLVVYDADEQISIQVVTSLVERGYDNIFMLSGGLKVAYQKTPSMITGTLPKAAMQPPPDSGRTSKRSSQSSTVSEIQLDPEMRTTFTRHDVDRLEDELGLALEAGSSGRSTAASTNRSMPSSRMSVQSDRASVVSNQSARWK
jgi:centrosomal protein CEP41